MPGFGPVACDETACVLVVSTVEVRLAADAEDWVEPAADATLSGALLPLGSGYSPRNWLEVGETGALLLILVSVSVDPRAEPVTRV